MIFLKIAASSFVIMVLSGVFLLVISETAPYKDKVLIFLSAIFFFSLIFGVLFLLPAIWSIT